MAGPAASAVPPLWQPTGLPQVGWAALLPDAAMALRDDCAAVHNRRRGHAELRRAAAQIALGGVRRWPRELAFLGLRCSRCRDVGHRQAAPWSVRRGVSRAAMHPPSYEYSTCTTVDSDVDGGTGRRADEARLGRTCAVY